MNVRVDGFAWVGVCMDGPMFVHTTQTHFFHVCVCRAERERVGDFVEIVTCYCMYMSIVTYGLFV